MSAKLFSVLAFAAFTVIAAVNVVTPKHSLLVDLPAASEEAAEVSAPTV